MRLLCGPPGTHLSILVRDEMAAALVAGEGVTLVVPTASMAEHTRHELARLGHVFDPAVVITMAQLVNRGAPLPEASAADLETAVADVLEQHAIPELAAVRDAPGTAGAVTRVLEELSAAGCEPVDLDGRALAVLYQEVSRRLRNRGLVLRGERLRGAADCIPPATHRMWVDGFFSFSEPELTVLAVLAQRAVLTVTLPLQTNDATDETGTVPFVRFVRRLREMASRQEVVANTNPIASIAAFQARTPEDEAREVARRIAVEIARGCPAREIGVAVRGAGLWAEAITAALARFGIPFRTYLPSAIEGEPVVRWITAWASACETQWEHGAVLTALRLAIPAPAADAFDFGVRERLPGSGIDSLRELTGERLAPWLDAFALPDEAATGPEWAERLSAIARWLRPPVAEPGDLAAVERVRRDRAARRALDQALTRAGAIRSTPVSFPAYWRAARTAIRHARIHPVDLRRDAVHVMSVHEARQWTLPVLFLSGLVEGEFPRHSAPDPFLPETERRRLGLRTAAAADIEERFLFEAAAACATRRLTLSWCESDTRGAVFLRSSLLPCGLVIENPVSCARRPKPQPPAETGAETGSVPLSLLAERHRRFSPSGLECFLDCPFQFFARHTLRLSSRPLRPGERLDFRLQGEIVHSVLAAWRMHGEAIAPHFDHLYEALCDRSRVPLGFRRGAVRLQLRADLERFAAQSDLPAGERVFVEWPFETHLDMGLPLRGRIDRVEVLPDGRLLVVDYKYSALQGVRERTRRESALQGALYAVAAERTLSAPLAAMVFASLKRSVAYHGWGDLPADLGGRLAPIPPTWREDSLAKASGAATRILEGAVAPAPSSPDLCPRCEFRDVCRYEASAKVAGAAG